MQGLLLPRLLPKRPVEGDHSGANMYRRRLGKTLLFVLTSVTTEIVAGLLHQISSPLRRIHCPDHLRRPRR
jgi:hypothetical protein